MTRKIRAIWELTRLEHGLMYGFGVLIGIIIAGGRIYEPASIYGLSLVLPSFGATFGFFTALFIQAGTFALNDYCDLESDIANQRQDRPLVRGELKKEEALLVAILATTIGIIIASFLHPVLFILAFISGVLGILYDLKMKEFLAVSNIYIALTMAIPFIFGGLIVEPDRIDLVLLVLAAIAFLTGFGREVMKDIADIKGDALRDIKSIARLYGVKQASRVVLFSYALAVVLSAIPLFSVNTAYYFNLAYLFPVMAADALFLHTCFQLLKTRDETGDYNRMRKETLLAIGIGLIAFVSGALWQVNFL
ncbi:MAG TPA: UbiA family prenyltransferase [Desulfobacteria bacterium]|nr:UbiA family prenyltransferase [Desulfobacteria bacterium]